MLARLVRSGFPGRGLHRCGVGTRITTFAVAMAAAWAVWRCERRTRRDVLRLAAFGACAVMGFSDGWWVATGLSIVGFVVSLLPLKSVDQASSRVVTRVFAAVPISMCLLAFAVGAHSC
jgi:hypothetical protein